MSTGEEDSNSRTVELWKLSSDGGDRKGTSGVSGVEVNALPHGHKQTLEGRKGVGFPQRGAHRNDFLRWMSFR